jgi:hypothetical protein
MGGKCSRREFALIAIAAIVFGQLAMTVYACPLQPSAAAVATTPGTANDAERNGPCADMSEALADAQGNACEVHCTDGIFVAAQPDLPPVPLSALPAPGFAVAELRANNGCPGAALAPISRAPPLTLQFCRLLI